MRPRILTFADYFLPGYKAGGPIRTLANMCERLGDEFDFRFITRNHDYPGPDPYPGIMSDRWQALGRCQVLYLSPGNRTMGAMLRAIRSARADLLYLNSLFSPVFSIQPLLLRRLGLVGSAPVVLAPRGELSAGALALKRGKKSAFLGASRVLRLHRDILWQASSPREADDIRRSIRDAARVHVAPDFRQRPPAAEVEKLRREKRSGGIEIAFLSRVNRMKNLDGALRLLDGLSGEVRFNIYGPLDDPEYWRECQPLIRALPGNVRVEYHGAVPHDQVASVLSRNHLLLLPTLGENFGHVILEALQAACPVLVSDRTPWVGLAEQGAGWDLPLERPDAWRTVLQECIDLDDAGFARFSAAAFRYGAECSEDDDILEMNRSLFWTALRGGPPSATCAPAPASEVRAEPGGHAGKPLPRPG